jgi:hypothetical protein
MPTETLSLRLTEPFGKMVAGHALQVDFMVLREAPGETEAPFDLAPDRFEIWIRARDESGEVLVEQELAKVEGKQGCVSDSVPLGDDATDALRWAIEKDDTAVDPALKTQLLFDWVQAITAAP